MTRLHIPLTPRAESYLDSLLMLQFGVTGCEVDAIKIEIRRDQIYPTLQSLNNAALQVRSGAGNANIDRVTELHGELVERLAKLGISLDSDMVMTPTDLVTQ